MSLSDLFKCNYYGEMTKAVNAWWSSIDKPSDFYDKISVDLDIHLCGSEDVIESTYSKLSGNKTDYPGTAGLASPVEINGRWHLFVRTTEIGFVTQEANYFTAGHELLHIVRFANQQRGFQIAEYPDPDELHKGN